MSSLSFRPPAENEMCTSGKSLQAYSQRHLLICLGSRGSTSWKQGNPSQGLPHSFPDRGSKKALPTLTREGDSYHLYWHFNPLQRQKWKYELWVSGIFSKFLLTTRLKGPKHPLQSWGIWPASHPSPLRSNVNRPVQTFTLDIIKW